MKNNLLFEVVSMLKHIDIYKLLIIALLFIAFKQILMFSKQILQLKEAKVISELKINNDAVEALDDLIKSVLDEYMIFYLNTKELNYIPNKEEEAIIKYMQDNVPSRVPMILLKKLEYNINSEYIGAYIGTRIYMIVLDFVLEFNTTKQVK